MSPTAPPSRPELALVTVSTYNYLHYCVNLLRTVAATWKTPVHALVALTDGFDRPRPGFEDLPGLQFVDGETIAPEFAWLAAKYDATDLCCALKPFAIAHAFDRGFQRVVYSDSDQHFFDDPGEFLELGARRDVVVIPHTLKPLPPESAWSRPSLGDLYASGMMNAGLSGFRDSPAVRTFLSTWQDLVSGPGAFVADLGPQHEQNSFNWALAFLDDVAVYRDPRINVAYWNLHERPVRWSALDGGSDDEWLLHGSPLISFHFSGFADDVGLLSKHDHRTQLGLDLNAQALTRFYSRRLAMAGRVYYQSVPYPFGGIDRRLRESFRRLERTQSPPRCRVESWVRDLAAVVTELMATPGPRTVIPEPLDRVLQDRPDLQSLDGGNPVFPYSFLRWTFAHLHREYPIAKQVEPRMALGWDRMVRARLAEEVILHLPGLSRDQAVERVVGDRLALLDELASFADTAGVVDRMIAAEERIPAFDAAFCLRWIYTSRADLQQTFADPLGRDLPAFRAWLKNNLEREYEVPDAVAELARRLDPTPAVARLLSFFRLSEPLTRQFRSQGLGRGLVWSLAPLTGDGAGFTATDLVLVDWWLSAPARAVCLELPLDNVIEVLRLAEDPPTTGGGEALSGHVPTEPAAQRGVNVFGYFASPIGLGRMSRGVVDSLALAGLDTREIVLSNTTMRDDLAPQHLLPDFEPAFADNLVVTYPHIQCDCFQVFPTRFFNGRQTAAYLAWEQRDLHPDWGRSLARYDRLFALSSFAAESLARGTGRKVSTIPCVVEVDEAAARSYGRAHYGIPTDAFVVGLVLDASSSLERKNPVGAVQALIRAFSGYRDVFVVLKITNGDRGRFRARVTELAHLLRGAGIPHLLETRVLDHNEVLGLIASLDLYISLHRAEGFGYTLAEAMALGVPVVGTRYSGNLDFMNDGNSWLVSCGETTVSRPEGPFRSGTVWAEPDLDDAAEQCRAILASPAEAARRAARGREAVLNQLSARAISRLMAAHFG